MKYILLFLSIILLSFGQISLKHGINLCPPQFQLASILKTLFNPYVILGYFFYGTASILGLFVLKQFPVSVAFPSMSLTYVIVMITSALFFGENFTSFKLVGLSLIMLGVFFISRSQS